MIVAIFVFAPIGLPAWWVLVLTRILGVPLIAGISFEIIKWRGQATGAGAGCSAIMWPGLQLQKLTTREPDSAQLAVAIAALDAVLADQSAAETRRRGGRGVGVGPALRVVERLAACHRARSRPRAGPRITTVGAPIQLSKPRPRRSSGPEPQAAAALVAVGGGEPVCA